MTKDKKVKKENEIMDLKIKNKDITKDKVKSEPMICPACKTPYWRTKRKNKKNGVKKK